MTKQDYIDALLVVNGAELRLLVEYEAAKAKLESIDRELRAGLLAWQHECDAFMEDILDEREDTPQATSRRMRLVQAKQRVAQQKIAAATGGRRMSAPPSDFARENVKVRR